MTREALGEENMSRTRKSKLTVTENRKTGEEQSQQHSQQFL
jgi:hypothetical protein